MQKLIPLLLVTLFVTTVEAQNYKYGYLVEFTDKNNTEFSINQPEAYLSQRAINRREKFNIPLTEQDLPVNRNYIDSITKYNAVFHNASKWMNSAVFLTDSISFDSLVKEVSFVKQVSLIYLKLNKKSALASAKFGEINHSGLPSDIDYGESKNQIEMLNGQVLHNQGYLGEGIHIAVLDAGFSRVDELNCFDSLFANNRILGTYDFVQNDSQVYEDHYHGMAVLSTMAANLEGEIMGTAPHAKYWLLRSENAPTEFPIEEENWIAAAEFADSAGADIITASLGYSSYDILEMSHSYSDMDGNTTRITQGAEIAFSKGMFLVNSAGNEGSLSWHYITAPSDGENVLCVGAVDGSEVLASFSSRGPSYDNRIKPDVVAQGQGTTVISSVNEVVSGNGTSFSCPVTTGMVACLWQSHPDLTNKQLLDFIRQSADRAGTPDNLYGYGVPDFGKALLLIDSIDYDEFENDNIARVYPNPVNNELHFDFYSVSKQEIKVELFNAWGAKIHDTDYKINATSYNQLSIMGMQNAPRGIYTLVITTSDKKFTEKVINY